MTDINESQLPPQLRRLVRALGLPNALRLCEARGGTQLHVPVLGDRATTLKNILGQDCVKALCVEFGGQRIDVPKADKILQQIRNKAIVAARESRTAPQVALEYGLTRRQVINITNQENEPNPNLDLFDKSLP